MAVPVTTIAEKPKTVTSAHHITDTGYNTKTVTNLETHIATKTYSTVSVITTTIYDTKIESDVKTNTKVETVPYTSVETNYSISVGNDKETYVITKTSEFVATKVRKVPVTSTEVETKTDCTTKRGTL